MRLLTKATPSAGAGRRPDGRARGGVGQAARLTAPISPVWSSASTSTNRPATSGSTPQEMSLIASTAPSRSRSSTTAAVTAPATPSAARVGMSSAEAPSRTTAVAVNAERGRLAAARQRRTPARWSAMLLPQRVALRPAQHQIGGDDREHRRQQISRQPLQQRRHLCAVNDEIGRIGDRQHERRRIGDEGADQKIRQRLLAPWRP